MTIENTKETSVFKSAETVSGFKATGVETSHTKYVSDARTLCFVGMIPREDGIICFADNNKTFVSNEVACKYNGTREIQRMFEFNDFIMVAYGPAEVNNIGIEEEINDIKNGNPNLSIGGFCGTFLEKIDNDKEYKFIFGYKDEKQKYLIKEATITKEQVKIKTCKWEEKKYCIETLFADIFQYVIEKKDYSVSTEKYIEKLDKIFKSIDTICMQIAEYNPVGNDFTIKLFKR